MFSRSFFFQVLHILRKHLQSPGTKPFLSRNQPAKTCPKTQKLDIGISILNITYSQQDLEQIFVVDERYVNKRKTKEKPNNINYFTK